MPQKNKEALKEYQSRYYKERRLTDPEYKARTNKQSKEWWEKHKETAKLRHKDCKLKRQYNISLGDYNNLLEQQQNVCAICSQPESSIDSRHQLIRKLAVDHCHSTGKVRGLLCQTCNTTLGKVKESEEHLQALINYLRKHK